MNDITSNVRENEKNMLPTLPKRRIAEKARKAAEMERLNILNYQAVQRRIQEIARAREEARRAREEAKRKKAARHPLQDLWDRNGAAIYAANQSFKAKHGRNMSASTRRKAIKDATVGGVFSAGAYAGNLVKAATPPPPPKDDPYAGMEGFYEKQDKINAEMLAEVPELQAWAEQRKQEQLEAGLLAYYNGRKLGELIDEEVLYLNQMFDPYKGVYASDLADGTLTNEDINNINMVWNVAKRAYFDEEINLTELAENLQKNPLTIEEIYVRMDEPGVIETLLTSRGNHKPYVFFLGELDTQFGTRLQFDDTYMQYEANYLDALMQQHPDVLTEAKSNYAKSFPYEGMDELHAEISQKPLDGLHKILDKLKKVYGGSAE